MDEATTRRFGAVEAGGTKFVCAIGDETGAILAETRFPTTDPLTTLRNTIEFFRARHAEFGELAAIGVGAFGPIELDRESEQYGSVLHTPKPGWSGTDLLGPLACELGVPLGFDTDVTAAALAEHRWGAARDVSDLVYVTVGTGIGGGALVGGRPVHGLMHPEMGHLFPRRHALDVEFAGVCPFHGDCLEGLAAGPAIIARSGASLDRLAPESVQWEIEADYLGQLCANLVLMLSPQRIVLGGGVMNQERLYAPIRRRLHAWLGGYIGRPEVGSTIDGYVVAPGLGARAGILGALALALDAAPR
jgi:fructokinase